MTKNIKKLKLCPFEQLKKFKTGWSIKCPRSTQVSWTQQKDDASIQNRLRTKRQITCSKCRSQLEAFWNG